MHQLALRQRVVLEHRLDRLQIEFRWQVRDGPVLFVKGALTIRRVVVTLNKVMEQLLV